MSWASGLDKTGPDATTQQINSIHLEMLNWFGPSVINTVVNVLLFIVFISSWYLLFVFCYALFFSGLKIYTVTVKAKNMVSPITWVWNNGLSCLLQ